MRVCVCVCVYVCVHTQSAARSPAAWASLWCAQQGCCPVAVHPLLAAVAPRAGTGPGAAGFGGYGSIAVHGLGCPLVGGIFPDQGSHPRALHWQADDITELQGKPLEVLTAVPVGNPLGSPPSLPGSAAPFGCLLLVGPCKTV